MTPRRDIERGTGGKHESSTAVFQGGDVWWGVERDGTALLKGVECGRIEEQRKCLVLFFFLKIYLCVTDPLTDNRKCIRWLFKITSLDIG